MSSNISSPTSQEQAQPPPSSDHSSPHISPPSSHIITVHHHTTMDASADHDTAKTFADDPTDAPSSSSATMITIAEYVTAYWLISEALSIYLWWMTRGTIITTIPTASTIEITHESSSDTTINEDATDAAPSGATDAAPSGATNVAASGQNWFQRWKPLMYVVLLKVMFAGMNFFTKLALNEGMNNFTFVFYRNAVASVVISPFAFYFERNIWPARSQVTCSMILMIVALSILGPIFDQDLYFLGMKNSSAAVATAMGNLVPAMTFILAWAFSREKVDMTRRGSQAKVFGTFAVVAGALILSFVKGPVLLRGKSHGHHGGSGTLFGTGCIVAGCFSSAVFAIIQDILHRSVKAPLSIASLICILGVFESGLVAMFCERRSHSSIWDIFRPEMPLFSAVYAGIFCSGLGLYLSAVVSNARGPVYSATFNSLTMVIVVILGILFLGDQLMLGSLIGVIVIFVGLYCFTWGKSKDIKEEEVDASQPRVVEV